MASLTLVLGWEREAFGQVRASMQAGAYRCGHEATELRQFRKGGIDLRARAELRICALFETALASLLVTHNAGYFAQLRKDSVALRTKRPHITSPPRPS